MHSPSVGPKSARSYIDWQLYVSIGRFLQEIHHTIVANSAMKSFFLIDPERNIRHNCTCYKHMELYLNGSYPNTLMNKISIYIILVKAHDKSFAIVETHWHSLGAHHLSLWHLSFDTWLYYFVADRQIGDPNKDFFNPFAFPSHVASSNLMRAMGVLYAQARL